MIKGMWKSKDKILLMFLIGQVSCSFSFSKSLFAQNCFSVTFSISWVAQHGHLFCYSLFFIGLASQLQLFCKVFWHHDKNNLVLKSWVERPKAKGKHALDWARKTLSPLMTPWPGRNESPQRRLWTSLNSFTSSSVGCSGIANSSLPWSLAVSISCRITLLWTVLSVRFPVKLQLSLTLPNFALLYFTLLHFTSLHFTFHFALRCFALLHFALLCFALLYF